MCVFVCVGVWFPVYLPSVWLRPARSSSEFAKSGLAVALLSEGELISQTVVDGPRECNRSGSACSVIYFYNSFFTKKKQHKNLTSIKCIFSVLQRSSTVCVRFVRVASLKISPFGLSNVRVCDVHVRACLQTI